MRKERGRPRSLSRKLSIEPVERRWLLAAPIALDDHYQTLAGQTLEVGQSTNTDTVELIAARSIWKYLDNGSDQGTAWRAPGFNDSDWNSGPAELGYGDGDEATRVDCGPAEGNECNGGNPASKYITTYFRRQFTIADRSDVQSLDVLLNYDDGAVVYLNGVQIARRNMPDGPNFNYQSLAPAAVEDTGEPIPIANLTGSGLDSLVTGENTIAVEIHQNSLASSDISFDLRLLGAVPASTATGVLANDTDADGDRLSAILESLPDFGTVELATNGSFRYTPADDFTGQDSFTYRASDGANVSNLATVTIDVTAPPNSPPVANEDVFAITVGGLVEGNVLSNDTDRESDSLAVVLPLESNVAHGELTISAEGVFTYRPVAAFVGTDRFTYRASDGIGVSNIATVRLVVTPANRPPVAADDHYEALAGQALVAGQSDDGRTIELIAAASVWKYLDDGSDQGTAWRAPEFNDSTWNSGPAELGYGDGDEATRVDCGPAEGNECNGGNPASKYITTYFRRQFTIADRSDVQSLDVQINYDDGAIVYLNGVEIARRTMPAGDITYTTAAIAAIEDTAVPVSIANLTGSALVSLVSGENTIAVEIHQQASTSSDISFDFRLNATVFVLPPPPGVLANDTDADGDLLMAELVTPPSHGTLQFAADGSFTYRPTDIFTGQDTFSYRANDGRSVSDVATVTIEVRDSQENRAPVAHPDEYSTPAGEVLRVGGPSDPDGNTTRTLIARGATWRYLDNGTDQGTAWRQLDFNDQSWAAGPAELGYGDGDEVTVVDCGPAPGNECNPGNFENKYITTYFRRHVQIEDPSSLSGVRLGVNFDDGVVVYINGQEVVRRNLPNSDIRFNTLALSAVEDTNVLELMPIEAASLFRSGDNVIASEIHQNHAASSDISFDLELVAMSSAPLLAGVLANDIDADGDSLTALLASPPAHGTVQFASDGSFVYSPSAGFVGEDSFTYRASDGIAASNVATVTVRVTSDQPVDYPPVALEDHYTLTVGPDTRTLVVPTVEGVLRNDHDPNGDALSARLIDGPSHGDLDLDLNGGFVYTPAPDFVGIDTFYYRAVDGGDNVSAETAVTIEVRSDTPGNHPPVAHDDQYHTLAGQILDVGEAANTDSVELIAAGAVWKYLDNGSDQGTAWRTSNFDDSTWSSGPAQLGYGEQDEATVVAFGSANEKSITTYFRHRFALNGSAAIEGLTLRLLYDDGAVVYVNGQEAVRANMPPGEIGYRTTAATNVQPENTFVEFAISPELLVPGDNFIAVEIHQASPVSNDISFDLSLAASRSASVVQGVLANDTDPDGDPLTAVLVRGPLHGTVQLRPNGSFSYTSSEGFSGTDVFRYKANDGRADSGEAIVTITVDPNQPGNRPPVAVNDEYETRVGEPLEVGAFVGTETLIPLGAVWRYLDNGSDQATAWRGANFDDRAWPAGAGQLGFGDDDETTVLASGASPIDSPHITYYFRHTFNVSDVSLVGSMILHVIRDDGAVVYLNGQEIARKNMPDGPITHRTLAASTVGGEDESRLYASSFESPALLEGENILAVEVHQATAIGGDLSFDLELLAHRNSSGSVLDNDSDPDGDPLTARIITHPAHGRFGFPNSLEPNGSFTYIPDEGFTGVDTFTYQASDGVAASNVATVTITVRPREGNRHPLAESDQYRLDVAPDRQSLVVSADNGVLANDSDPDSDPLTATLSAGPEHGTVVLRSDGSFGYAPSGDFAGIDQFRYNAIDANGLISNIATVTIEVRREAPSMREFVVSTTEDEVDGDHSEGDLSLREAILLANTAANEEEMLIVVPAGVYRLTLNGNSEDAAATGDLDLTRAASRIAIQGAGAEHTVIDAGGIDRAFHFGAGVTATLEDLTIQGGRSGGSGGGIINFGSLLVRQVRLTDNRAREGGAIDNSGSLTIFRSTLDHNEASDDGGAVYSGGDTNLVGSTLDDNSAGDSGGGVYAATGRVSVRESTLSANRAADQGGAIYVEAAELFLINSTLADNRAGDSGGGIYAETGRVSVRESTLSANRAADDGGAIYVEAAELFLINSTLSGNVALGGDGGGIDDEAGSIVIENSTITRNHGDLGGGIRSAGGVRMRNTIVAGNSRIGDDGQPNDVYGTFAAGSRYNLIGVIDGSTGLSDVASRNKFGSLGSGRLDPRLGPLLDNGGPTKTHAILPGSVALDGGDPNFDPSAFSPDLTTDQRGFSRIADVSCRPDREAPCGSIVIIDIGAFELQPADPLPSPGDFNGDRAIDAGDIDLLMDVVRRASAPPTAPKGAVAGAPLAWEISVYDLTADSIVDHSDANYLIETVLETTYGDVDLDGHVGLRDIVQLRNRLGASSAGWADGDFNGDAAVDRLDMALLSANLGYRRGSTVLAAAPQAIVQLTRPVARLTHDAAFARGLSATRRPITPRIADAAIAQPDANDLSAVSRSSVLYATRGRASSRRDPN